MIVERRMAEAPDTQVLREAAEWFALLRSDAASDADRVRWRGWLERGGAQRAAWQRVEAVSQGFARMPREPARLALQAGVGGRRRALKALGVAGLAGGVGWVALRDEGLRHWGADYRTAIGETRSWHLADGTQVWLNTASSLDVDYGAERRLLTLGAGEVLIETAPDVVRPARPFELESRYGAMRALGTRFSVRRGDGREWLTVFDGAVALSLRHGAGLAEVVRAGWQVAFGPGGVEPLRPAPPARQAWHKGILLADSMRLGDVVEELAGYRRGSLVCDPAVADLRVVGAYALADTDQALAAIAAVLPVRIRRTLPWRIAVVPR